MKNSISTFILGLFFYASGAQNSGNCPTPANTRSIGETTVIESPSYIPDTAVTVRSQSSIRATGDRTIYWVPGLGLNPWLQAADAVQNGTTGFPARQVYSEKPIYDESVDFPTAFNSLQTNITPVPHSTVRTDDFIIAHSQGGLVSRALDRNINLTSNPRYFGGIVTFGTPHQGAAIINDLGAKLNSFTTTLCFDLSDGPVTEINTGFPFNLFGLNGIAYNLRGGLCPQVGGLVGTLANMKTGALAQYYKPNTTYLYSLNDYTLHFSTVPSVAFYGKESQNGIFFRTFYSFSDPNSSSEGAFQADLTDVNAINEAGTTMNLYILKRDQYNNLLTVAEAQLVSALLSLDLGLILTARQNRDKAKEIRDAYQKGIDWLSTADSRWMDVIGAKTYTTTYTTNTYHYCDCTDGSGKMPTAGNGSDLRAKYNVPAPTGGGDPAKLPNVGPCAPQCKYVSWTSTTSTTITNIYESDGVVLTSSASEYPGCNFKKKMDGSNHKTMKNDGNTKIELAKLLDGYYGLYFKTLPR